jgi:hypothetical protein
MRGLVFLVVSASLAQSPPPAAAPTAPPQPPAVARTDLNLLGRTRTNAGESRRNENVQFNLIDNNALKELNVRLGTTATIIDEFRADRSYFGAEFGNRPVAPFHLSPVRGNGFHGSLFETHLNSVFNARSFFTVGGLPAAHENNYGFAFGRRLWKGAAITVDGAQNRIRGNVNGNILVPLPGERTPLTIDPPLRAFIQRVINAYPAAVPNRPDINSRMLNTNSLQRINDDSFSARIDQAVSDRDTVTARHSFTVQKVDAFQLTAGQNPDTTTRAHTAQLGWNRAWTAATNSTLTALFDRVTSLLVPEPNSVGPSINFSNAISTLGPASTIPVNRAQNRFRYAAALRQVHGAHDWYVGAELTRRQINGFEVSSHNGTLQFRNDFGRDILTNFLMGVTNRFSGATGNVHRGFRTWEPNAYVGDSWKATSSLTLQFGLRWEAVSTPKEVDGLSRLDYPCDCNNFAPRFGLAQRLRGRGGVLRAAYGVHFGEIFPITFTQIRYNPPYNQKFEIQAPPNLLDAFKRLYAPVDLTARNSLFVIPADLRTPYTHLYNASWEPRLSNLIRLQLGYVGSRSHKLFLMNYTNRAALDSPLALITATVTDRRPDQRFHDVRRIVNGSHGYFDAARVSVILTRWKGLSMDGSYWWSKAIDLGAGYTNTATGDDGRQSQSQTETNVWADVKGPSAFDQRHAFLVRSTYATPHLPDGTGWLRRAFGSWDFGAVVLAKTGTPFTVVTGSDGPGFGNVDGDQGDRPNLVDPSILGRTIGHPDASVALLPKTAFAYIQPGEARGNLGSNTFRKDGIANVNASLSRTFTVAGDRRLTVRAESVNFFNTPQFAEPWRELTSPNFGFITNTLNDGRAFRFSARFLW